MSHHRSATASKLTAQSLRPAKPTAKTSRYVIKLSLLGAQPAIWRRVVVQSHINLAQLHEILQRVMGWEDCHLHRFSHNGQYYSEQDDGATAGNSIDESTILLSAVLQQPKTKLLYEYDFGDLWQHVIVLERILPSSQSQPVAEVLVGEGACPLEEIGGLDGWYYFLDVIAHPDSAEYQDEQHQQMCDWVDANFNPRFYDVKAVNQLLRKEF